MANLKEALVALQGEIAGLASGPGLRLMCQLRASGSSIEPYTGIDVDDADWSLLAAACDASLSTKRGRLKDGNLGRTLEQLVDLYERVTKKTFTHNPTDRGDYNGRLHWACDRFVYAVMQTIEPGVHETLICTYLQELKEARSVKAKLAPGSQVQSP